MKTLLLLLTMLTTPSYAAPTGISPRDAKAIEQITNEVLNDCSFSWAPADAPAKSNYLKSLMLHVAQLNELWCNTSPGDFALTPQPQSVINLRIKNAQMAIVATECVGETFNRYASFLEQGGRLASIVPTLFKLAARGYPFSVTDKDNKCSRDRKILCETKSPAGEFNMVEKQCQTYMDLKNLISAIEAVASVPSAPLKQRVELGKRVFTERLRQLQGHQ